PITAADRSRFGYMPEERGLYPKQPVIDQLTYFGQLHAMSRRDASGEAMRLLERFGLGGRAEDKLETLSLGNQQRVQIAVALLHSPTALILDEPFSGLDPIAVDAMVELLRERVAAGVPVLFSSHQLDLVDELCDSLVVLAGGQVMAAGKASELRAGGPKRYRITTEPDAGWLRETAGVEVLDVAGPQAVIELANGARETVLRSAMERGLAEFTPIVPRPSDHYRTPVQ